MENNLIDKISNKIINLYNNQILSDKIYEENKNAGGKIRQKMGI